MRHRPRRRAAESRPWLDPDPAAPRSSSWRRMRGSRIPRDCHLALASPGEVRIQNFSGCPSAAHPKLRFLVVMQWIGFRSVPREFQGFLVSKVDLTRATRILCRQLGGRHHPRLRIPPLSIGGARKPVRPSDRLPLAGAPMTSCRGRDRDREATGSEGTPHSDSERRPSSRLRHLERESAPRPRVLPDFRKRRCRRRGSGIGRRASGLSSGRRRFG